MKVETVLWSDLKEGDYILYQFSYISDRFFDRNWPEGIFLAKVQHIVRYQHIPDDMCIKEISGSEKISLNEITISLKKSDIVDNKIETLGSTFQLLGRIQLDNSERIEDGSFEEMFPEYCI